MRCTGYMCRPRLAFVKLCIGCRPVHAGSLTDESRTSSTCQQSQHPMNATLQGDVFHRLCCCVVTVTSISVAFTERTMRTRSVSYSVTAILTSHSSRRQLSCEVSDKQSAHQRSCCEARFQQRAACTACAAGMCV